MENKQKIDLEELKKITGGTLPGAELDEKTIETLNQLILWGKYKGFSKEEFLVEMVHFGLDGEALWYLGTHWEEINRG